MSDLKDQLIRLGSTNPEIRRHIKPVIAHLDKQANLDKQAGIYYWASKRQIAIGAEVPAFKGGFEDPRRRRIEDLFEEVRREVNPSAPPRIGSVMVCPEQSGFCGGGYFRPYVYEVEVRGKTFLANAELFTKATDYDDEETIRSIAKTYWTVSRAPFFPEILTPGPVRVLRQVDGPTQRIASKALSFEVRNTVYTHLTPLSDDLRDSYAYDALKIREQGDVVLDARDAKTVIDETISGAALVEAMRGTPHRDWERHKGALETMARAYGIDMRREYDRMLDLYCDMF